MRLTDIAPVAIILVVSGIALGAGAMILAQMQSQVTAGSVAAYALANATSGIATLASWLPTIALVIAAAVIIGIVFGSFILGRKGE